jgi:hypothetical protein
VKTGWRSGRLGEDEPLLPLVAPAKAGPQGPALRRVALDFRLGGNDGHEIAALDAETAKVLASVGALL